MKYFDTYNDVTYQLVTPGMRRHNAAELCIRTFKNQLVAVMISTDEKFPLDLWDRITMPATLTLNMLKQSRKNTKMSAHMALEGGVDYNKTPLAPPGTKVMVHKKKTNARLG